jgi:hypothetical protein
VGDDTGVRISMPTSRSTRKQSEMMTTAFRAPKASTPLSGVGRTLGPGPLGEEVVALRHSTAAIQAGDLSGWIAPDTL